MIKKGTVVLTIGKYNPTQKGHVFYFLDLLNRLGFEKMLVVIGSCEVAGLPKNPLLAFMKEKMLAQSLYNEGVDLKRIKFVHVPDFNSDEEWWKCIMSIPGISQVTHISTGNNKVIDIMKNDPHCHLKLINPEKGPKEKRFPYHSTDLRNAIDRGDYELFKEVAASGTMNLMSASGGLMSASDGFDIIRRSLANTADKIIPGRQTADLFVTGTIDDERMVLCGYRTKNKKNFPSKLATIGGGIDRYENPIDTVFREGFEEANFIAQIVNRLVEPTHIVAYDYITSLRFVGLFGTDDVSLNGSDGGSSQVFTIDMGKIPSALINSLQSKSDLERVAFRPVKKVLKVGLAYQQTDMLKAVLKML